MEAHHGFDDVRTAWSLFINIPTLIGKHINTQWFEKCDCVCFLGCRGASDTQKRHKELPLKEGATQPATRIRNTHKSANPNLVSLKHIEDHTYPSLNQYHWLCRRYPIPECPYISNKQKKYTYYLTVFPNFVPFAFLN